ncbi:TetR/AcrR family transcriptional regulator [Streptacidiphilus monticola]|jgi:AcrR family transcriptional regulator|uniref:TetR/AcrR family transcriptional regulator n=1 Tax=Streptacidiphilus monticola TaxID=2161674 RepID=A0ABW1FZ37_9ACTN
MVQQQETTTLSRGEGIPAQRAGASAGGSTVRGSGRLRVDARRNLESVLRAAREVFGELGYGAPMEEVARRAGVGVGTVYRRFPSKEVLVRRIAAEEVVWLTAQAREALGEGPTPWQALEGFLTRAVAAGAGRLLPPEAFRQAEAMLRVPTQRQALDVTATAPVPTAGQTGAVDEEFGADADPSGLLRLLSELVDRASADGTLRAGVTVSDIVLVLTASVPPHATTEATGPTRLLDLLLAGLSA